MACDVYASIALGSKHSVAYPERLNSICRTMLTLWY